MNCQEFRSEIDEFLDGALLAQEQEKRERHIKACPRCWSEVESIQALENRLRHTLREEGSDPERLWRRIRTDLASGHDEGRMRFGHWPKVAALAASVLLVVAAALVGRDIVQPNSIQAKLIEAPVNELRSFVASQRPLDLATADPDQLRDWFIDKVDFTPPTPATPDELNLIGGRLCYILDRRAASYMYRVDGRFVSLYVMDGVGLNRPIDAAREFAGRRLVVRRLQGYTHVLWASGQHHLSLVADLPAVRLLDIARRLIVEGMPEDWKPGSAAGLEGAASI